MFFHKHFLQHIRIRQAEHLWPAELKAEFITSFTTCSVSAELSAIRQLSPPVSAMKLIIFFLVY